MTYADGLRTESPFRRRLSNMRSASFCGRAAKAAEAFGSSASTGSDAPSSVASDSSSADGSWGVGPSGAYTWGTNAGAAGDGAKPGGLWSGGGGGP